MVLPSQPAGGRLASTLAFMPQLRSLLRRRPLVALVLLILLLVVGYAVQALDGDRGAPRPAPSSTAVSSPAPVSSGSGAPAR
jgi:hypothetical protein